MPTLDEHQSAHTTKIMLLGDSGTGKTSALAALANADYKLRILDFDNGLDTLRHLVKPEKLKNVVFETLTDKRKAVAGKALPDGIPTAFSQGMNLLTHWKTNGEGAYDLGKPVEWGEDTVIVMDSGTFASDAALRYVLAANGRPAGPTQQGDWGEAMNMFEGCLGLLYSKQIQCNVLVTFHISFTDDESGATRAYPASLGKKLPPKIGRYFNSALMTKTKGTGPNATKVIRTVSEGLVELKHPCAPGKVPAELPLATGLADFFKLVREA